MNGSNLKSTVKFDFKGKRAIVTGAGQGIGRMTVKKLIESGAKVVAVSKTLTSLQSLKEETGCDICQADLGNSQGAINAAKKALGFGDVHMLVCNAGVNVLESFLDAKLENFELVQSVNVTSVFIMSQLVAKQMIEKKIEGSIVNISSQASQVSLPSHVSYCTSKGALNQLTRCIALDLGPHGIRCNAVLPTVVLTELGKKAWSDPANADPMIHRIPLHKFAQPEDVIQAVLYLLSDAASMINGTMLPIDGGFLSCGITDESK